MITSISRLPFGNGSTHVVLSTLAIRTSHTRLSRFQRNSVSRLQRRDLLSDRVDDTGGFVAQDHGFTEHKVSDSSVVQVVHVGTADTGRLDFDEDILGSDLGNRSLQYESQYE